MPSPLNQTELEKLLKAVPLTEAPPELWSGIQSGLDRGTHDKPQSIWRRPLRSPLLATAAILTALLGGTYIGVQRTFNAPARWNVVPLAGIPFVADGLLEGPGNLEPGQWLVTDETSSAVVSVGKIGTADVGPNSRLRLDDSHGLEHRLTLERGSLEAFIAAPPRLFFVETPAALATDLGCAYTLTVDSAGTTRIHVTSGWVELGRGKRTTLVPAGFVAVVEVGGEPGTPFPVGWSRPAQDALGTLDRGAGDTTAVVQVLREIPSAVTDIRLKKDAAITLWHLLQKTDGSLRAFVFDSMAVLSPPPSGVTREGILDLKRQMLEAWRRDLRPMWSEEEQPFFVRLARHLWEWTI